MKVFKNVWLLFFLFYSLSLEAQVGLSLQQALDKVVPLISFPTISLHAPSPANTPPVLSVDTFLSQDIPSAYSYQELGLFCKIEVQLEKKFKLPVKVRLGEVQYTEQLEYGEYDPR